MGSASSLRYLLAAAIGLSITSLVFNSTMLLFLFLLTTGSLFVLTVVTSTPTRPTRRVPPPEKAGVGRHHPPIVAHRH